MFVPICVWVCVRWGREKIYAAYSWALIFGSRAKCRQVAVLPQSLCAHLFPTYCAFWGRCAATHWNRPIWKAPVESALNFEVVLCWLFALIFVSLISFFAAMLLQQRLPKPRRRKRTVRKRWRRWEKSFWCGNYCRLLLFGFLLFSHLHKRTRWNDLFCLLFFVPLRTRTRLLGIRNTCRLCVRACVEFCMLQVTGSRVFPSPFVWFSIENVQTLLEVSSSDGLTI